jgi:putative oxidoreductase
MQLPANDAIGKLLLRVLIGGLMLPHGIAKLGGGAERIAGMISGMGLPGFLGYGVLIGEIVAPLMMIAGFYMRAGALLVAINMVVAIGLVHAGQVFSVGDTGGLALELQYLLLFGAIAAMLLGPGRHAINDK